MAYNQFKNLVKESWLKTKFRQLERKIREKSSKGRWIKRNKRWNYMLRETYIWKRERESGKETEREIEKERERESGKETERDIVSK